MSIVAGIYALSMFRCSMEARLAQESDQATADLRTCKPLSAAAYAVMAVTQSCLIEARRISGLLMGSRNSV
jgi:hypothetical protein